MQVLYLGRAPRTKETLPDFLKWRRVTRPPLVFRGLTGSQRTPGFWGVTAKLQVATFHAAIHVATSKMMSRHPINSTPYLLRRDAILPCRDVPCSHPCRNLKMMSRHQFPLAKPETHYNPARSRRHFLEATSRPTKPGRDLITMSRPQEVLTH